MNLVASFSGGETSAYMTRRLLTRWHQYKEIIVLFANASEENEETLQFVHECDQRWGFNTVWVEADVTPEKGVGTGHRIVTFETASRKGEPYEEVIKKYGLPGPGRLHCTRELKLAPMLSYLESIGWTKGTYYRAIGIRADERHRCSISAKQEKIIYPLVQDGVTKPDVNEFFMAEPFRLDLMGYEGNCKWCWKKSLRKLLAIMAAHPEKFDFPERMEKLYGTVGHEFDEGKAEYLTRTLFRGNLSTKDLRALLEKNRDNLDTVEDDSIVLPLMGRLFPLDMEEGCVESCEVA